MTFYSIMFGVLFIGSVQALIHSFSVSNWNSMSLAGVLCILIFNDTLYTSHIVDKDPKLYSVPMKRIDLLNFFIFALCILCITPDGTTLTTGSFLDLLTYKKDSVVVNNSPSIHESIFWLLLVIYTFFAIAWNHLSENRLMDMVNPKSWLTLKSWLVFFPMIFISYFFYDCKLVMWLRIVIILYLLIYLLFIKSRKIEYTT